MFQNHNLGAKFHRSTLESHDNLRQSMQGILTETMNGSVTEFVAIPFVTFFPAINSEITSVYACLSSYQMLNGNQEPHCDKLITLDPPIYAYAIKIFNMEWARSIDMRLELLGCFDNGKGRLQNPTAGQPAVRF